MSPAIYEPVLFLKDNQKIQGFISSVKPNYEVTFYSSARQEVLKSTVQQQDIVGNLKDNELNLQLSYLLKSTINNNLKTNGKEVQFFSPDSFDLKKGVIKGTEKGNLSIMSDDSINIINQELAWF